MTTAEIFKTPIFLAPMAGVTDTAFRVLVREILGDVGKNLLMFSEMVSAAGVHFRNEKTLAMLETCAAERPVAIQIFGSNSEFCAEAAAYIEQLGSADVIDFNCGSYSIVNGTLEYEYDFYNCSEKFAQLIKPMRKQESAFINLIQTNSDSARNVLTEKMKLIITGADSVVCYLLDPMDKSCKHTLQGVCILEQEKTVSQLVDSLKEVLLDKDNFVYSEVVKNCIFLPDVNFRLFANGEYADVLFAFYCDECRVICNGESVQSDSENMRKRILEIAMGIFPKDKYIRFLLNK